MRNAVIVLLALACAPDLSAPAPGCAGKCDGASASKADWTVLLYLANDDNALARSFDRDVFEIQLFAGAAGDEVQIVAQRDFGSAYAVAPDCSTQPWGQECPCWDCAAHGDCFALDCCETCERGPGGDCSLLLGCEAASACAKVDRCFDLCCVDGDCRCVDETCGESACEEICREQAPGCAPDHEPYARARRLPRTGPPTVGTGMPRQTQRFRVAKGRIEVLEELDESSTGDPAVLADFLIWGARRYPADRYLVILNGHGSSWDGAAFDKNAKDALDLDELEAGFRRAVDALGRRFDVVVFDQCLMASVEVAYQLRDVADFFVGSEEREPSSGHSYRFLAKLLAHPGRAPRTVAKEIVYDYVQGYSHSMATGGIGYRPWGATAVALELGKLAHLTSALVRFKDAALASSPGGLSCATIDRIAAQVPAWVDFEGSRSATMSLDLYELMLAVSNDAGLDPSVRSAANEVRSAIGYARDGWNPTQGIAQVERRLPGYVVFGRNGWHYDQEITVIGAELDGRGPIVRTSVDPTLILGTSPSGTTREALPAYLMFPDGLGGQSLALRPWTPGSTSLDYFVLDAAKLQAAFFDPKHGTWRQARPGPEMLRGKVHAAALARVRDTFTTSSFPERNDESPFVAEGHGQALAGFTHVHGLALFFAANRNLLGSPSASRPGKKLYESYQASAFARDTGWRNLFGSCLNRP